MWGGPGSDDADPGSNFRRRHRHGEEPGPRHAPRRLRSTEGDWKDIRYRCIPPLPPEGGPIGRALRGGGYGGAASASAQLKPMVVHIDFPLAPCTPTRVTPWLSSLTRVHHKQPTVSS